MSSTRSVLLSDVASEPSLLRIRTSWGFRAHQSRRHLRHARLPRIRRLQRFEGSASLAAHIRPKHIPFPCALDVKLPVYIVEPSTRDDGIVSTISRIKKARYPYRSFHGLDDL